MTRIGLISLAALALVATGCVNRAAQEQAKVTEKTVSDPTVTVSVQPVGYQTLTETLQITGQVTTSTDTQVGAKISGKITAVFVKDGDPVVAGQTIAIQETTALSAQLNQALSSVQTASSSLQSANAALAQAIQNARVQPTKSASAVHQAEAQVRSAKAQLDKTLKGARTEERSQAEWAVRSAKSNLDKAQKDLERYTTLVNQGAAARTLLDQAQNAYNTALAQYNDALQKQLTITNGARPEDISVAREAVRSAEENLRSAKAQQSLDVNLNDQVVAARAQVSAAKAQMQSAQAQVTIAQQALSDATIKAPFAGKVAGNPVQVGTVAAPGTPIARIVGKEGSYFEGEVPEMNIDRISVGSPAKITVSALEASEFSGVVKAISPSGETVGRLFRIRVAILGNPGALKPGMYAKGEIVLRTIPNASTVPAVSIVQRGGKDVVFVAEGDKAKAVPVKTGLSTDGVIQVDGLQSGQQVVTAGANALDDGSKIKIEKAKQTGA